MALWLDYIRFASCAAWKVTCLMICTHGIDYKAELTALLSLRVQLTVHVNYLATGLCLKLSASRSFQCSQVFILIASGVDSVKVHQHFFELHLKCKAAISTAL